MNSKMRRTFALSFALFVVIVQGRCGPKPTKSAILHYHHRFSAPAKLRMLNTNKSTRRRADISTQIRTVSSLHGSSTSTTDDNSSQEEESNNVRAVLSAHIRSRTEKRFFHQTSDAFLRMLYRSRHEEILSETMEASRYSKSSSKDSSVFSEVDLTLGKGTSDDTNTINSKQKDVIASDMHNSASITRGGGGESSSTQQPRPLAFWENMVCGAISRSTAQTFMHPANTMKTILQSKQVGSTPDTLLSLLKPKNFRRLTTGAGANFLLSVPHGAVNFAVLEFVRSRLNQVIESTAMLRKRADRIGPGLDFLSSCISTITCSIVSTPQMMITDNIMVGNYPNLPAAITGLAKSRGIAGFYAGWWPGLAGKIPSYALTWTLFQQLKATHRRLLQRPPKDIENSIMGSIASATTVCIMIPMDTIKTRLVTQASIVAAGAVPYKGILDCAVRVAREEGIQAFYRGLPPRLVSVVPMIGIQFGVYEFMKKVMRERSVKRQRANLQLRTPDTYAKEQALEEASMEVAASNHIPFPAPKFQSSYSQKRRKKMNSK